MKEDPCSHVSGKIISCCCHKIDCLRLLVKNDGVLSVHTKEREKTETDNTCRLVVYGVTEKECGDRIRVDRKS